MSPRRILIVRFSAIGDCVMCVPAASRIRRSEPESFLAWVVESRCAEALDTETLLSRREEIPWEDWKRRRRSPRSWFAPLRAYMRLRRLRFDLGLDFHGHAKTAICLRLAAPMRRFAVRAVDPLSKGLNPVLPPAPEGTHIVEANLMALDAIGGFAGSAEPIMPRLDAEREAVRARKSSRPLAAIAVGASFPEKAYPIERWAEVAKRLLSEGAQVAFLGGKGDPEPDAAGVTNLVGELTLRESMAWAAESDVLLSGDTGMAHIAAAYGVPTVTVFGPTDPSVFRPYSDRGSVLREGDDPACVEPDAVVQAALKALEANVRKVSS